MDPSADALPVEADNGSAPMMKFDDLPLSKEGKLAMREGFGYEYMKPVQANTFDPIKNGSDCVVKAKTGSGKTLSFLLPAIERTVSRTEGRVSTATIDALIVSPVRELSMQIFQEAEKLTHYYSDVKVLCMVGGVDWQEDMEALDAIESGSIFLVVTPGRLQTHINKTTGFAERLAHVDILVLDEVDQLTNDRFLEAAKEIIAAVPPSSKRQSLFYSATMTEEVMKLMNDAGKADHIYVDMLKNTDISVPDQIQQTYRVVATEDMTLELWKVVEAAKRLESDPKIVVIFMTGRIAAYYAEAFRKSASGLDVFEIHAQIKKQEKRTEASDQFRAATGGVLFTSDVSSRGLDYPGVTDVVQMGAPTSKAEYIHRLGRTGRGGKAGRGILLLHQSFEPGFLNELNDLPLSQAVLEEGSCDVPDFISMDIGKNVKAQAYYSRINHVMRHHEDTMTKLQILQEAKTFAASIGALDQEGRPPEITLENATKMGVADIVDPALYIVTERTEAKPAAKPKAKRPPKGDPSKIPGYNPDAYAPNAPA